MAERDDASLQTLLKRILLACVVLAIGLGEFPSLNALFQSGSSLGRYLGPINPLKALAPALLLFVWLRRKTIPRREGTLLVALFGIGTIATAVSAARCGFPPSALREWAVISLGTLGATCFLLFPAGARFAVLGLWALALYGGVLLNIALPGALAWFHSHVFDPGLAATVGPISSSTPLIGFYGVQSAAKLLAWVPWILLLHSANTKLRAGRAAVFVLCIISSGLILMTTQRGPFVGAIAGWVTFGLHQWIRNRDRRAALLATGALVVALALTATVTPRDVLITRSKSLLGMNPQGTAGKEASATRDFRFRMAAFSLRVIGESPLGNSCIPENRFKEEFANTQFIYKAHSHNMFLQQFLERGWIWGVIHAALWFAALLGAWRTGGLQGSALSAGIATVIVSGLSDHPWFVLNHALVLSTLLLSGLRRLKNDA